MQFAAIGLSAALAAPIAQAAPAQGIFLVPLGAQWRYHASASGPGSGWEQLGFDDARWRIGAAGFGYGDDDDATILDDMEGRYASVYLRREFELPSVVDKLYLYMRYDDAFELYLNGRLAARAGLRRGHPPESHEADQLEVFELSGEHLVAGLNLLAVRGVNASVDSSDFSLHPGLALTFVPTHILAGESARRDLAYLRERLIAQSSYLESGEHDVLATIEAVSGRLPEAMLRIDFLRAVRQIIALIGDGHASASAAYEDDGAVYLPFSLADTPQGVAALRAGKRGHAFVDPDFPFIAAIDDVPLDRWLEMARRYHAYISPQLNRRRAVRSIRRIDKLRDDLGLAASDRVSVTLAAPSGEFLTRSFPVSDQRPASIRSVPLGGSRILPGDGGGIGYLVIREMEIDLLPEIHAFMDQARHTRSLIIDVRGNGGGRLQVLLALAPYFFPPDARPVVANIAAYRLAPHFKPDHLAHRPTFRLADAEWTGGEREVIKQALARFQPLWIPPPGKFSAWHFMLINRQSDRAAQAYHYDRPVAVLANEHGFSATDGFLNGFCEIPGTMLIGQPSSGASGRTKYFLLPESEIEVGLSSMASFRPNGQTFDGFGVGMDYYAAPRPEDFLGQSDAVLAKALELLERRAQSARAAVGHERRPCREPMEPR
ncbi:MAG: S41 family peptidase [Gammaproteobacteria bacterium]|nr:S41 family peptidase [Gammaproteobacteria bacterium]MCY4254913.1 S41 family peptidase [Gammaproteobacteria bacterium]